MKRRVALLAGVLAWIGLAVPAAASPVPARAPLGGTLVDLCYDSVGKPLNSPQYAACRGFQAVVDSVASLCRLPARDLSNPALIDDCGLVDGRRINETQIAAYRKTWVSKALSLQNALTATAPLDEELIPGSHNSFNASSYLVPLNGQPVEYFPSLTNQDPNQVYSISDQLQMGIRGIEIDLHWVPSVFGSLRTGGYWVDACHGQSTSIPVVGTVHVGCTIDRSMQNAIEEVRRWVRAHPHEFLLVYLENQLDNNVQAHNIAASILRHELGHLVYRPSASLKTAQCADLPLAKSESAMARTGARVLLVGNCGPGNGWNHLVFTRGPKWNEGGNPTAYGARDCAADRKARDSDSVFRRWYEESPFLEAVMGGTQTLSARVTRAMVRCGVNLTGFDQLTPFDGRLKALVWSWAAGQPSPGGGCAYQGRDGRFRSSACGMRRHVACVAANKWQVTDARVAMRGAGRACRAEFPGSRFSVPANGLRNAELRAARPSKAATVWLNYRKSNGAWHVGGVRSPLR